jgi:hypothetical protein
MLEPSMVLPELDPDQRRAALLKAAEARRVRAELKDQLKLRAIGLPTVFARAEREDAVAKMRVTDVLAAMPAYGPVKARRLMEELDISTSRRVRGLGPRQRQALLATFESGS